MTKILFDIDDTCLSSRMEKEKVDDGSENYLKGERRGEL